MGLSCFTFGKSHAVRGGSRYSRLGGNEAAGCWSWANVLCIPPPGHAPCSSYFYSGMSMMSLILCDNQSKEHRWLQIALTNSITSNISNILSPSISPQPLITKQDDPSVAVFYSITSSQPGLSGIDLGNFLIKRVVRELIRDVPSVKTFCTLSPIPGFRQWLEAELERSPETVFLPREVEALQGLFDSIPNADAVSLFGVFTFYIYHRVVTHFGTNRKLYHNRITPT